ncbi:hypothetical protein GOP47_0006844 [Adiantum capillus-veneris]|uniref:DUF4220 domain-containing protein n=1 Tax=Adiantum capillus-veneris TaxID=13818 RepID=A0A9D4V4M7_ADICA|nr:hypothetical protein GOP47_0006844 [Adiantum capillus-veneris]
MRSSIRLDEQDVVAALSKWWISVSVMLSLFLQLLLLLTGGTRKWNSACRFVAWNAYNWSDCVATTALGGLAQAAVGNDAQKKEVYALWAPILLLHLGAPDNISAYAMADAELWQRHGLTALLEISIVIYVVANCARGWNYVLLSVCLTALGSIKYAERTFALKRASRADITQSALSIYKYMLAEADIHLEVKGPVFSPHVSQPAVAPHSGTRFNYYYIIHGEKQWLRNFLQAGETGHVHNFSDAVKASPGLVTLQDILSSNEMAKETPSIVLLCVGFAFFKLYKRRLCNLYMYEWRAAKTRELFLGKIVFEDMEKLMFVLDVELRFLFDSLYTKAADTAFSKTGVTFRIITTILLEVSAVFILGGNVDLRDQAIKQARDVTFCLISVAVIIEVYQLARLMLSDWCRVWLACKYILVGERLRKKSEARSFCCLRGFSWLASNLILKVMKLSSSLGRHKYWTSHIGQYTMIESGKSSTWLLNINAILARFLGSDFFQVLPEYERNQQAVDEFKRYVMSKVIAACRESGAQMKVVSSTWFLPRYERRHRVILQEALGRGGYVDFEHLVVNWHVATCVSELLATSAVGHTQHALIHNMAQEEDMRVSKLLSKYLMYLLVYKPELLPCHAEIGRQVAADTQRDLRQHSELFWDVESITGLLHRQGEEEQNNNLPFNLRSGIRAASLLQNLNPGERWKLIGSVWVDILMCAAACNKPAEQLEQLTLGGEFLTHLWVLLGHLGCGAQ